LGAGRHTEVQTRGAAARRALTGESSGRTEVEMSVLGLVTSAATGAKSCGEEEDSESKRGNMSSDTSTRRCSRNEDSSVSVFVAIKSANSRVDEGAHEFEGRIAGSRIDKKSRTQIPYVPSLETTSDRCDVSTGMLPQTTSSGVEAAFKVDTTSMTAVAKRGSKGDKPWISGCEGLFMPCACRILTIFDTFERHTINPCTECGSAEASSVCDIICGIERRITCERISCVYESHS
jgi:hypothetical protein